MRPRFPDRRSGLPAHGVPENAYLTNPEYGAPWACERGFRALGGRCAAIAEPANAFLDPDGFVAQSV